MAIVEVTPVKPVEAALQAEQAAADRTHQLLKRSEEALRRAQRLGQIGSWEWEVDVDIVSWSEELYAIFELDPTRLPPTYADHARLYEPRSWQTLQRVVGEALASGAPFCVELQFRGAKGREGWIEGRGEAVVDEHGRVLSLRGTSQVITDRRALHQLQVERTTHAIVRAERDALMRVVSDRIRTTLNRVLGDAFLLQGSELRPDQESWLKSVTDGARQIEELLQEIERPESSAGAPCRVVPSLLARAGAGLGAAFDLTSDARYRAFFEQDRQFAAFLSLDGILLEANGSSLQAGGYARENMIGLPFWECAWWAPSEELVDTVREAVRAAAAGIPSSRELRFFLASGEQRRSTLTLFTVSDDTGKPRFIAATGSDITEQKAAAEQMTEMADRAWHIVQLDRRKTDFLPVVAHELRNLLAPLSMRLQWLERHDGPGPRWPDDVAAMLRQTRHISVLIDDLLDTASVSRGAFALRLGRIDLRLVLRDTVDNCLAAIGAAGHDFVQVIPTEPLWLQADQRRLVQVFTNLLGNAVKYTAPGGRIELSAALDASWVNVKVTDSGTGLAPEEIDSIFGLFEQVEQHKGSSQGGFGIGLSVVRRLVEKHGGSVSVSSAGPGTGSVFSVRLPRAAAPAA